MNDKIYSPEHYTSGSIECIDAIEASMSKEEFQGFCKGNVMKYLWRWKHKGGVESLEKAKVYLDWMIATEKFK